nr:hypothetical protein [Dendronalium sp. ChiSLP03b]
MFAQARSRRVASGVILDWAEGEAGGESAPSWGATALGGFADLKQVAWFPP